MKRKAGQLLLSQATTKRGRPLRQKLPSPVPDPVPEPEVCRCFWAGSQANMIEYHDIEWGVPVHDDRRHFEFLVLESAQAGLSWQTVLNKRHFYRQAFKDFDPVKVAEIPADYVDELLKDEDCKVVKNRKKLESTLSNAAAFIKIQEEFGSFDSYVWSFVQGEPIINKFKKASDMISVSDESRALSKDLKKRGFKFLGDTTVYAYMQACGLVMDHVISCFRYKELSNRSSSSSKSKSHSS